MADPLEPEFTAQNPIVAAASKLRARREIERAIDAGDGNSERTPEDAEESLALFHARLLEGAKRLESILGKGTVKIIRLEKPLRLRVRFGEHRVSLDLDDVHQLVRIAGLGLDGEYQFEPNAATPALINLSKLSTEAGYGEALTASSLLKLIAQDAELPRPSHLSGRGPLQL
jgi:predicted xylose isomerase-like sugar epimerase